MTFEDKLDGGRVAGGGEMAAPIRIANNGAGSGAEGLLGGNEGAAFCGSDTHDGEKIAGDGGDDGWSRNTVGADGFDRGGVLRKAVEGTALAAHILKIEVGKVLAIASGVLLPEANDLRCVLIRLRAEQNAVDDAEDRSGRADAERKRENGN